MASVLPIFREKDKKNPKIRGPLKRKKERRARALKNLVQIDEMPRDGQESGIGRERSLAESKNEVLLRRTNRRSGNGSET